MYLPGVSRLIHETNILRSSFFFFPFFSCETSFTTIAASTGTNGKATGGGGSGTKGDYVSVPVNSGFERKQVRDRVHTNAFIVPRCKSDAETQVLQLTKYALQRTIVECPDTEDDFLDMCKPLVHVEGDRGQP